MDVAVLRPLAVAGKEVPGARLRALLVPLLLAAGSPVSTSALLDAVWGEDLPAEPAAALQALVSRVRRTTGVPVELAAGGYRVPAGAVDVDLLRAEASLRQARTALAQDRPSAAAATAGSALTLWPPSTGDHDPDPGWRQVDVARAAAVRRDLLLVRYEAALRASGAGDASVAGAADLSDLTDLEVAVSARPLDEPLAALLLRCLAAQGRAGEALERFERVRGALAEYGSDPSEGLRAAHTAVLRGEHVPPTAAGAGVPPQRRGAAEPALEVPVEVLGRTADLAALSARVREHGLVTLVGPGGVGKTTLVTALAHAWRRGGAPVVEVPLAGLRSSEEVLPAVLATLVAAQRGPAEVRRVSTVAVDAEQELVRAAASATGLLVLDNCEHLLDAVADVVLLLRGAAGPGLRIVATSRSPLEVVGEQVHPLAPLDDEAARAVLVRRVAAVRPGLVLAPQQAEQLCRRLDNLPLALELAAARLRSMPVDAVLAGLDDRFALLADGPRGLPERHRGLQRVIDWSWDLLPPSQRVLLARLSVFPAGATLDVVLRVCSGTGLPAAAVPAALAGLVDASLVVLDEPGVGPARHHLLETVRQYADARLDTAERAEVAERLATWAAWWSRRQQLRLVDGEQVAAVTALAADRDTLSVALRWAVSAGRADLAAAIAGALCAFGTVRGTHADALAWAEVAARIPGVLDGQPVPAPASSALRLQWEDATALACFHALNALVPGQLRSAARALVRLRRALRRPDLLSEGSRQAAGLVAVVVRGDLDAQLAAISPLESSPVPLRRAYGLLARAFLEENAGLGDLGVAAATEAFALFEQCSDMTGQMACSSLLGQRRSALGQHAEAIVWFGRTEAAARALGGEEDTLQARAVLLRQRVLAGEEGAAEELAALAATEPQELQLRSIVLAAQADAAAAEHRWDEAIACYDTLAASADRTQDTFVAPQWRVLTLVGTAVVRTAAGRDGSHERLQRAFELARTVSDVPVLAAVALGTAAERFHRGDLVSAGSLWALAQRLGASLAMLTGAVGPDGVLSRLGEQLAGSEQELAVRALDAREARTAMEELLAQVLRR